MKRRRSIRLIWPIVLLAWGALSYFGVPLPRDWAPTGDWSTSFDVWVLNHAAYPGQFLIVMALLIGTVIAPEAMRLLKTYFSEDDFDLGAKRRKEENKMYPPDLKLDR